MDPYDVIIMPWITEKTLEARRIADLSMLVELLILKDITKRTITESSS